MRDRMAHTGHAMFALEAVRQPDMWRVTRHYQTLMENGELPHYPHATKPPGQLLFYMTTERLSRVCLWCHSSPLRKLSTLASILWPFLAHFPVVPIYLLARLCFQHRRAYIPCLLYLCVPTVMLITLHLDQCLYPFLFVSTIALCIYRVRSRSAVLLSSAGLLTSLAGFVSFSLIMLLPFVVWVLASEVSLTVSAVEYDQGNKQRWPRLRAFTSSALYHFLGVASLQSILFLVLNYNAFQNYRFAMSQHQAWKLASWSTWIVLRVGYLDVSEFEVWSDPAFSWLTAAYMAAARLRITRHDSLCGRIAVACVPILLCMTFLGKTIGETARLWLFLTPLLVLFAGQELITIFGRRPWLGVGVLAFVQPVECLCP